MVKCKCGNEAFVLAGAPEASWEFECCDCNNGRWYFIYLSDIANDPLERVRHVEAKNWVGPDFRNKVNEYLATSAQPCIV